MSAPSQLMGIFEHLEELRKRLMIIVATLAIAAFISYFFSFDILELLKKPLPKKLADGSAVKFYYQSVMDPFMARAKIALLGGVIASAPVIFYEILAFLSPALKEHERKWVYPTLGALIALFMSGVSICYFFVIPPSFKWLISQGGNSIFPILTVTDYVRFVSLFLLAFGVAFEAPVVVLLLIRLGIVKRKTLREQWRMAYVVCFTVAAFSTPDWSPMPMIILGVCLVVLYEASMLIARFIEPKKRGAAETAVAATTE